MRDSAPARGVMIFIDANQYLDLYRTIGSRSLLAAIDEQRDYIFITAQIVDEVNRNKVNVVAKFLADQLTRLQPSSGIVPNHLLSAEASERLRNKLKETKTFREELDKLTPDLLRQVSQSTDEMSKALERIFSRAVRPEEDELRRARYRKEHGNPPGKQNDPLGDQLNWEQILTRWRPEPGLWIITKDYDYATEYDGEMFLNAALYQELIRLNRGEPKVFCYDYIPDGLRDFAEKTKVRAEKLPTPAEAEKIKKEQESLPPLGWLQGYDDSVTGMVAIGTQEHVWLSMMRRAALESQKNSEEVILPPAPTNPK